MRIGIIGGGVIARLFLEHIARGDMGEARVVAIQGRSEASRGKPLAEQYDVPFVTSVGALIAERPEVVIEAASHDAVREFARPLLEHGIPVIILSGGALCDDALRARLEATAAKHKALLYLPSGGIGGLDALKAVCVAGADSVEIAVTNAYVNFDAARIVNPQAYEPNLGERAAVEVIEEPARLQDDDRAILLCEETAVTRRVIVRERDKIIELSTMDFLRLLESEQRIQSADAVFERALAAGRNPSRMEKFGEHDLSLREAVRDTLRAVQRDPAPKR